MDQPKLLGRRVRTIRRAAKITQEDVAEKAHLNPKYPGEIERGEKRPSFEAILALAKALNASPATLFQFYRGYCESCAGYAAGRIIVFSESLIGILENHGERLSKRPHSLEGRYDPQRISQ